MFLKLPEPGHCRHTDRETLNVLAVTPVGSLQEHCPFPCSVFAVYRVGTLGFVPSVFEGELQKRFGIQNKAQFYFKKLLAYVQNPGQNCKAFADEFEQRRLKSGIAKDQAYQWLQNNTYPPWRNRLLFLPQQDCPTDYDSWIRELVNLQQTLDIARKFKQPINFQVQRAQTETAGYHRREPDVVKMEVDAIAHRKILKRPGPPRPKIPMPKKTLTTPRPPIAKPPTSSLSQPESSSGSKVLYCYRCNEPGHFMRNCPTKIANIDEQHIQQLAMFMETAMASGNDEIVGEEIFAIMENAVPMDLDESLNGDEQQTMQHEVETNLIDLEENENDNVNVGSQGF